MKTLIRKNVFLHLNCHVVLNRAEIKNIHVLGTLIKLACASRTLDRFLLFVVTNFVETSLVL